MGRGCSSSLTLPFILCILKLRTKKMMTFIDVLTYLRLPVPLPPPIIFDHDFAADSFEADLLHPLSMCPFNFWYMTLFPQIGQITMSSSIECGMEVSF